MPLARINVKLEIIDGPDAGYTFEETNKIINLKHSNFGWGPGIKPYEVTFSFCTPDIIRQREERFLKEDSNETKQDAPS